MINQFHPISFQNFTLPEPVPVLTYQSLTFLFLNTLSLGVYGTVQIMLKDCTVTQLQLKQENLQAQAADLFHQRQQLNDQIQLLREELNKGTISQESLAEKVKELEEKVQTLQQANLVEPISLIATNRFHYLSAFITNLATLGLYAFYQRCRLESKISILESENSYIQKIAKDKLVTGSLQLQQQLDELIVSGHVKHQEKEILQGEIGAAYKENKTIQERLKQIELQQQNLTHQISALKTAELQFNQTKTRYETLLRDNEIEVERLREENKNLRQIGPDLSYTDIDDLRSQARLLKREAKNTLQAAEDEESNVNLKLLGLKQVPLNDLQRVHLPLGPIPPKYSKRKEDGEIAGDYGLELGETDDNRITDYAKRYNGKKTALEVVKAGLEFALDNLLAEGKKDNAKIHFNSSANIYQDTKFLPNKNAVYRHVALDFISHAKLSQLNCHGFGLKLNDEGVVMGCSKPERVQSYQVEPQTGERKIGVSILPTHIDEFSPAIGDRDLIFGIDPASAKWIFAQLSETEKHHLYHLLMEPLIDNEDPDLKDAQEFINAKNEKAKLVRTAYELICDMASSIEKNFEKKGLNTIWGDKADDYDVEPFEKPEKEQVIGQVNEPVLPPAIVEWKPDGDAIKVNQNFGASIEKTVKRYQAMYAGLSKEAVNNPSNIVYGSNLIDKTYGNITLKGIKNQFLYKHPMLGDHGCLMSTMLTLVTTDVSDQNGDQVQKLQNAMAAYLDKPENAERFKTKISNNHRKTVAEYQRWLRTGNPRISDSDLGDLEIELVANLIGVRFAVFYPNVPTKLNEFGLTVPVDDRFYYGPNTKEMLFIYNNTDSTYGSLWPQLKANGFSTHESKSAWESIEKYSTSCRGSW